MPRLSLGLGVNGSSRIAPAAPSGIPVASTSQIIVTSTNSFIGSAPFNKISETIFENSLDSAAALEYIFGAWTFYYDGSQVAFATSPAGYIPTSGYTIIDGGGSFTITAAIPVSTTSLLINGGAGGPTNTFTKYTGNTDTYICYYQQGSSDPTTKYTFNHLWQTSTYNGGSEWAGANLGVATRKHVNGSGYTFITGSNCSYDDTTVSVSPTWILFSHVGDEYGPYLSTYATNPSQDFNNVPTTGWIIHRELTSVTITAA